MKLRALTAGLGLLATGTVIGATTQQFVSADVTSGDRPVLVPIDTCRLVDTRSDPEFNVGPRNTPLGREDTHLVNAQQPGTDCTGQIPAGATALSLNITAPDTTEESFITIWGSGDRPNASSLNPQPGQLVFNAVTVDLAADQTFRIFNNRGNTNIIIDVNGYYENHNHDDRYYTQAEVDAAIGTTGLTSDTYTKTESDNRYYTQTQVDTAIGTKANSADTYTKAEIDGRFDQQKMINIQTMRDHNGESTDARKGPLGFETSLILPPDYTTGTDLRLELVYFHFDFSAVNCSVTIRPNYFEGVRPSTSTLLNDDGGNSADGLSLSGGNTITFTNSSIRQIQTLTAEISQPGTIPLEAGDALNFGFFVSGNTCKAGAVGTHSAAIYYD